VIDLALSAVRTDSAIELLDAELAAIAVLDTPQRIYQCPFRIIVDVNEGFPYRFSGLVTDKSEGERPIVVETVARPLYQAFKKTVQVKGQWFNKGLADYTIEGMEEEVQVERKSLEDLYGTLGGRRDDFEAEIARLNLCRFAAVVIEASWAEILFSPPSHSKLLPKTVSRTVQSWSIRYPAVHWFTCAGRQHAEAFTFQVLNMFWRQRQHARKEPAE